MLCADVRRYFPGLEDKTFLDAACVSLIPVQAKEAIVSFLDQALVCPARDASYHHIAMDEAKLVAVHEAARLLSADPPEIALVESTTHGLNIAANAIPLSQGDNILLSDLEFLQVAIPWSVKAQTLGVEIRQIPNRDGRILIEDISDRIDERTRVICISSVQWSNGYQIELQALSQLTRLRGIYLVVDAVQQLGAFELNVQQTPVDFLTCGGHKWLNAPFGAGILYIRRELISQLNPAQWGYLALEDPEEGWGNYFATPSITPFRPYNFQQTAKKFEIAGTSNYPGAIGLGASLKLINDIGIKNIESHIRHLTDLLFAGLQEVGVKIVSHADPSCRSGIVTFSVGETVQDNQRLLQHLLDERILVAIRYTGGIGGIRVSVHFFNNQTDIERLVATIKNYKHR